MTYKFALLPLSDVKLLFSEKICLLQAKESDCYGRTSLVLSFKWKWQNNDRSIHGFIDSVPVQKMSKCCYQDTQKFEAAFHSHPGDLSDYIQYMKTNHFKKLLNVFTIKPYIYILWYIHRYILTQIVKYIDYSAPKK